MAATQLVNAIYIIRGTNCKHLHELHEKYGNIVRTGPNELSFRSASAVKTIYGGNPRSEDTFHKNMIANMQESGQSDNLFFAIGSKHQHYRKIIAPAFSEATIRAQEPMVYEYCTQLVNGLRNRSGTAHFPTAEGIVDIVPWTHFIVSDILSHVLFGSGLECLKRGGYHPWVAGGFNALIESTCIEAAQRLWPYHKICEYLWIPSSMSEGYQTHLLFSSQKLQERVKDPDPYKYAFSSLVSQDMSEQELLDNVNVVATAAGETTSSTISAALYYLTSNNAVYNKLVTEIREAFRTEEEITSTSTAALLYLKATIRETFRIHPTIPVGLHRITPKKGKYIDGTWVPGGVGSTQLSSTFHSLTTRGL
jgi:cytochrome P450